MPPPRTTTRRRALALGLGASLTGLARHAAAAEAGVDGAEIVIGQSITLQGGRHIYGAQVQSGVRLQIDELNRSGGILGRRLVLRTLDDDNDNAVAAANARKLVADGAFILFGSIEGGPSTAVMKVATTLGVPFFGPMAGSPGLRRPHQPLVFPVRAEHRDEFRALIAHGKSLGLQRVALFHADSDVGREHLANVRALAEEQRMGFAGGLPFPAKATDAELDAALDAAAKAQADLVINHGSAPTYERLIRRARAAGSRTTFWGVNSGSTPLAAALGPLAHGMVFSQIVPNPASGKTALAREYRALHGKVLPDQPLSYGGLEGFMTTKALAAALRAAGRELSRASLLAALQELDIELGGLSARYRKGAHAGCSFVDLALVGRDGRFVQ